MKSLPLQLHVTVPHACNYLESRLARSEIVVPPHLVKTPVYSQLIQQGFRRSGQYTYRPACEDCQACVAIRVSVQLFQPNRTQERLMRRLADLDVRVGSAGDLRFDEAHYALYRHYQQTRHAGGGMDEDGQEQYEQFLLTSMADTSLVEFYAPDSVAGGDEMSLKMVSVVDFVNDGLSAVYTFFDPDDVKTSWGTYGVLWQIAYAKALGLPYVYLGYWIADCQKMSYKTRFKPFELLSSEGVWVEDALF